MRVYLTALAEQQLKEINWKEAKTSSRYTGVHWTPKNQKFALNIKFDEDQKQYYVELDENWLLVRNVQSNDILGQLSTYVDNITIYEDRSTQGMVPAGIYTLDDARAVVQWNFDEKGRCYMVFIKLGMTRNIQTALQLFKKILSQQLKPIEPLEPDVKEEAKTA